MALGIVLDQKHSGISTTHIAEMDSKEQQPLPDKTEQVQQVRASDDEDPAKPAPAIGQLDGWRLYLVQFCLLFGLLLSVIDSSIVSTALVVIGREFNDFITLQWIVLSYLLAYLGFAMAFPRISDVIGRKWTTFIAYVVLTIFSLACGLSQSLNQIIAFRALQGVGGSGLFAMSFTTLPEITPPKKYPLMTAFIGIVFTVSGVLGPVLGGVITTNSTWRWCFLLNVPCGVVALVVLLLAWPNVRSPGRISFRQLDYLGCVLFAATSVLLVFALQEGGSGAFAWNSGPVVASLVVAGVAGTVGVAWIWWLSRKPAKSIAPLFHGRIVAHRILGSTMIISALIGYIFYATLIGLPERFQILNGRSAQSAGLSILPLSGASAVGSFVGGVSSSKRNNTFVTVTAAAALALLGSALLYSVELTQAVPNSIYGFQVLLGLSFGLAFSSTTVMVKIHARAEDNASAQGLLGQVRILGGNIGLAVASIVLHLHFESDLQGVLTSAQISDLIQSLNVLETLSPRAQQAVAVSFAKSFRTEMEVCAVLAAVALVLALTTWQRHAPTLEDAVERAKEEEAKRIEGQK